MSAAPPMTPPPIEPVQPGMSQAARIINTYFAPSKTFEDIRRNASWWVPLLLSSVFAIALFVTIDKKVGFDQVAQTMMSKSPQFQQQPIEQQQKTTAIVAVSMKYSGYAAPIFIIIYALVIAAVLMATFNFGMQAEVPFSRALAIVIYSWLPGIVSSILGIVSLLVGNPDNFHFENPVATNAAYFLDPTTTSKFVYALLQSFDVIGLWIVVLMGIGFAVNAKKKISIGTGIMVVGAWYFLIKLLGAAWAGMRG